MKKVLLIVLIIMVLGAAFLVANVPQKNLPKHLRVSSVTVTFSQSGELEGDAVCPAGYKVVKEIGLDWCEVSPVVVASTTELSFPITPVVFEEELFCMSGQYLASNHCYNIDVSGK